jgi:DNA adenine methylase
VLLGLFPKDFKLGENRYFEPFLGGGAVLFAMPQSVFVGDRRHNDIESIYVNDANAELINTYEVLKSRPATLVSELSKLAIDISESGFYVVRGSKPKNDVRRAARFIYLNRLCFNGLHRVNSNGEFNVPYGRLKNPTVCDTDLLFAVSEMLQAVVISNGGFAECVKSARRGDLVYFDPPYVPLSPTASFSRYSTDDFGEVDHRELADVITNLTKRGVRVVLSNSSARLAREIFQDCLNLYSVKANRSISASGSSRTPVKEIIGLSYERSNCSNPEAVKMVRRLKPLS